MRIRSGDCIDHLLILIVVIISLAPVSAFAETGGEINTAELSIECAPDEMITPEFGDVLAKDKSPDGLYLCPQIDSIGLITNPHENSIQGFADTDGSQSSQAIRFGLVAGSGTMRKQFDWFGIFGIQGGYFAPEDKVSINVGLQYIPLNFTGETGLDVGVEKEKELAIALNVRYYFTPAHTFMGIYAYGGFRKGLLLWRYDKSRIYEIDGKTEKDGGGALGTYWIYLGLGASIIQTDYLHIGGNVSVGVRDYYENTIGGRENDIFAGSTLAQFTLDLSFCSPES